MNFRPLFTACLSAGFLSLAGCSTTPPREPRGEIGEPIGVEYGLASYYGRTMWSTEPTASGERFHASRMTAAHRRLPFGSMVRVTNLRNGRAVVVRINDRGPFKRGRIIDVSKAAAKELGMLNAGVVKVRVENFGKTPLEMR